MSRFFEWSRVTKKTVEVVGVQDNMGIIINCEINIAPLVQYSFDANQWAFNSRTYYLSALLREHHIRNVHEF